MVVHYCRYLETGRSVELVVMLDMGKAMMMCMRMLVDDLADGGRVGEKGVGVFRIFVIVYQKA